MQTSKYCQGTCNCYSIQDVKWPFFLSTWLITVTWFAKTDVANAFSVNLSFKLSVLHIISLF